MRRKHSGRSDQRQRNIGVAKTCSCSCKSTASSLKLKCTDFLFWKETKRSLNGPWEKQMKRFSLLSSIRSCQKVLPVFLFLTLSISVNYFGKQERCFLTKKGERGKWKRKRRRRWWSAESVERSEHRKGRSGQMKMKKHRKHPDQV